MAGIYSQGGSAGHRYAGWLSEVEAKNFTFGGKVFNGSPSAIYVGSNLVWANWLTKAAKQAIVGAFGQRDGMAVINATNAYLTQLAASDRDKATALAGFINEDPMMVCSLGLEVEGVTMPIRWLVGDGNVWLKLAVNITSSNCNQLRIKSRCKTITSSGWRVNGRGGGACRYFGIGQNNTFAYGNNRDIQTNVSAAPYIGKTIDYDLDFKNGKFIVKHQGNTLVNLLFTASSVSGSFASLYCWNNGSGSGNTFKAGFASAEYQFSDVVERNYIPFYNNGSPCLLDLETLQMDAIKMGSGTLSIELTQQDGVTPWTPSTPLTRQTVIILESYE